MIIATFKEDGEKIVLDVTGHSGRAKHGEDIICAGASTLAYTVAQTMRFMYEDGLLKKAPVFDMHSGDAHIEAEPIAEFHNEALHTFYVAQVGFNLLAHNFPKNVTLISFGEAEKA